MVDKPGDGVYTSRESIMFSKIINDLLGTDEELKASQIIPLNLTAEDLGRKTGDGVLLW